MFILLLFHNEFDAASMGLKPTYPHGTCCLYRVNSNEKQAGYPQVENPQNLNPQIGNYPVQGSYPLGAVLDQAFAPGPVQPVAYPQQPAPPQGFNLPPGSCPKQEGYPPDAYPTPQAGYPGQPAGVAENLPSPPTYVQMLEDGEESHFKNFDFSQQSIRKAFIRKVYSILMCQLLVTVSIVTFFVFHEPTKYFVRKNIWLVGVAVLVSFSCIIVIAFIEEVRRRFPMNLIFLAVFTVAKSLMLGVVSAFYNGNEVLIAIGVTAAICLGLTIFALQTKWDFTMMGGGLICGLIILVTFGIISYWTTWDMQLRLWLAGIGVFLFSLYLIYDTQAMIGGKHKYTVSPEEYIFAALSLYLDIINIFVRILFLLGRR